VAGVLGGRGPAVSPLITTLVRGSGRMAALRPGLAAPSLVRWPGHSRVAALAPTRAAAPEPNFVGDEDPAVAVKIKLKRMGKIRAPYYRIIVADARTKRDGRAIEEIGKYHPKDEPSLIEVDSERAQHWLSVGAQPTDPVRKLLEVTGDWQKFKGLPGAEGTLKTAAPKADKKEAFAAAVAETLKPEGETKSKSRSKPAAKAEAAADAKADTGKQAKGKSGSGRSGGKAKKAEAAAPETAAPESAAAEEAGKAAKPADAAAEQESGA